MKCKEQVLYCLIFILSFSLAGPISGQEKQSLFQILSKMEGMPHLSISTDFKRLVGKKLKEEYQEASLTISHASLDRPIDLGGRIRARGNLRKQVCRIPPVKYDVPNGDLEHNNWALLDKLQFVFPCRFRKSDQEKLYKEELLYQMYAIFDSNTIQTKLLEVEIIHEGETTEEFVAFIIEDEEEYAHRTGAKIVESGRIVAQALDREAFLKMLFFQYMIANVDWAISEKHNIQMVKLPDIQRVVPLPYDFDYSGFVDQNYAVPHESLPIKSVHERYFFPYQLTDEEIEHARLLFLSKEEDIYSICESAHYLEPKTIQRSKKYLKNFFDLLRNPKSLKRRLKQHN